MTITKQHWVVLTVILVALSCCSVFVVGVEVANTGYLDSLESTGQHDMTLLNEVARLSRGLIQFIDSTIGLNRTCPLAFGVCGSTVVLSLFVAVMAAMGAADRLWPPPPAATGGSSPGDSSR